MYEHLKLWLYNEGKKEFFGDLNFYHRLIVIRKSLYSASFRIYVSNCGVVILIFALTVIKMLSKLINVISVFDLSFFCIIVLWFL